MLQKAHEEPNNLCRTTSASTSIRRVTGYGVPCSCQAVVHVVRSEARAFPAGFVIGAHTRNSSRLCSVFRPSMARMVQRYTGKWSSMISRDLSMPRNAAEIWRGLLIWPPCRMLWSGPKDRRDSPSLHSRHQFPRACHHLRRGIAVRSVRFPHPRVNMCVEREQSGSEGSRNHASEMWKSPKVRHGDDENGPHRRPRTHHAKTGV